MKRKKIIKKKRQFFFQYGRGMKVEVETFLLKRKCWDLFHGRERGGERKGGWIGKVLGAFRTESLFFFFFSPAWNPVVSHRLASTSFSSTTVKDLLHFGAVYFLPIVHPRTRLHRWHSLTGSLCWAGLGWDWAPLFDDGIYFEPLGWFGRSSSRQISTGSIDGRRLV